jgi:hypothetical protein
MSEISWRDGSGSRDQPWPGRVRVPCPVNAFERGMQTMPDALQVDMQLRWRTLTLFIDT